MKAQYKGSSNEADLTIGKKYDVIDVECKKGFEVSKIYITNDKQEECWYSVEHFIMYAEATAAMRAAAAELAQGAAMPLTPEPLALTITMPALKPCGDIAEMIERTTKEMRVPQNLMCGA